ASATTEAMIWRLLPAPLSTLWLKVRLIDLLLEHRRESRLLQVAERILQNRQCLGNKESTAEQSCRFNPPGDQRLLGASSAKGFSSESGSQVTEIIQNTEDGRCDGPTAIERHETIEPQRAGRAET